MSYLRYLCLFVYSGVQHILFYDFVLFVFVLCTLYYQFLWILHLLLPLRYSLTFMKYWDEHQMNDTNYRISFCIKKFL
jgi:hypothetical protein